MLLYERNLHCQPKAQCNFERRTLALRNTKVVHFIGFSTYVRSGLIYDPVSVFS